jgi:hypothetical protein
MGKEGGREEVNPYKEHSWRPRAWWCSPAIPAFMSLKQEDLRFKASLGYRVRPSHKAKG